ncbi:hypothetical protein SAMD00019534_081820 [Acytostelium subglobosum LB1]|uniref:hypothetical protein n=1 Tax=Acytostelium subglobosum LB1 TaxID=1410327 RepID=UPI000644BF75|nr:hypothetical protein SAMD00019534_081820 [Acytostelium subglobosum LB1]GAM25007.1 hypothetical protein SAMD00019534_081820 [Acytostelium subglobosum LB1]|eukprot:XP_012752096.1 hypothetical protein SAMD00019534_081820 [Acytostelium subglobosum LB1]
MWINEKCTSDLLPFQQEVVDEAMKQITLKEELCSKDITDTNQFTAFIYEMEIERLKYLIRSYLRCRLQKVERYHAYITKKQYMKGRLSTDEMHYCNKYALLVENHFNQSFLHALDQGLDRMEPDSVQAPSMNQYVFCTPTMDIDDVQIGDDDQPVTLMQDGIYLLKYSSIHSLVETRKVNLI